MKQLFLNADFTYNRLLGEYKKHGSIVVAFDFDNTVYDYHKQDLDCSEIIDLLQKLKSINCFLIVWTANADEDFVRQYCETHDIPFDAINENPPFFTGTSRKIYYNELLDDRAGLRESFDRLLKLYDYVMNKKIKIMKQQTKTIIGAIAGDVIGSIYEWENHKSTDFPLFTEGSRYTDDSVLTFAVADCILNQKPFKENLAFYGRKYEGVGFGKVFKEWVKGPDFLPYGSIGNGSAMRVSAVGFAFNTLEEVLAVAEQSAEVSHNSVEGIKGAKAVASAIFLAKTGKTKAEIKAYIETTFDYNLDETLDEIRPNYQFDYTSAGSIPQAIRVFLESTDYENAIRLAVSIGGDTDTIACMAGGIAVAFYKHIPDEITEGVLQRLPQEFIELLEQFEEKININ